jgi:hypothetical protein
MGGGQEMLGRVAPRRTVTASDVAARHTKPQMDPVPPTAGEAFGASVRCGCDRSGQPHMGTWGHLVSRDRGLSPSAWALGLFGAPRARVEWCGRYRAFRAEVVVAAEENSSSTDPGRGDAIPVTDMGIFRLHAASPSDRGGLDIRPTRLMRGAEAGGRRGPPGERSAGH